MNPDDVFLARAVELAHQGSKLGEGGPFGAVIVYDGKIVAEGWNRVVATKDPTAHAEIAAIRRASAVLDRYHLNGCTLYASSEPCPMCLAASYWARIERIVFANTRAEAAAIGFCDDWLYDELAREDADRSILMQHLPLPGATEVMHAWADNPCKKRY